LAQQEGAKPASRQTQPTSPALLAPVFRERLQAAMRIPVIEAAFAHPWTAAARRVLPSPSPQFTATAMWGPLLGWCVLELLAESIDAGNPEKLALDLFDRLRLREPFARAFTALGFDGQEGWRVAARIKVVLLSEAGVGKPKTAPATEHKPSSATASGAGIPSKDEVTKGEVTNLSPSGSMVDVIPQGSPFEPDPGNFFAGQDPVPQEMAEKTTGALDPGAPQKPTRSAATETPIAAEESKQPEAIELPPSLWSDPDVRWLTGAHEAGGHSYLVKEPYEELLWWMLMPGLLKLAGEPALDRAAIASMATHVDEALAAAEAAGYRIDKLTGATTETGPAEIEPVDRKESLEDSGGSATTTTAKK